MRFLYNATCNSKGGSAQRAATFVSEALREPRGHEWWLAITPAQADLTAQLPAAVRVEVFDQKPSQNQAARRRLLQLEQAARPDAIYTQLGPAYVKFRAPHLLGIADAWVTHPTWQAYQTLRFPGEWLNIAAASLYKALWLRRADAWVIETEAARQAYHRLHHQPLERIAVVLNTCGRHYREDQPSTPRLHAAANHRLQILTFAAPYPHKRLDLIPHVALHLNRLRPKLDFQCVVTLPHESREWQALQRTAERMGLAERLENRGVIPIASGPALYRECQLCLLPTVLETFSVSYPEAMAMERPMVTTDLPFARDICRDAALYFRPNDPQDAAHKIIDVWENPEQARRLIAAGREVLAGLPTATEQYHQQVDLLEGLVTGKFQGGLPRAKPPAIPPH